MAKRSYVESQCNVSRSTVNPAANLDLPPRSGRRPLGGRAVPQKLSPVGELERIQITCRWRTIPIRGTSQGRNCSRHRREEVEFRRSWRRPLQVSRLRVGQVAAGVCCRGGFSRSELSRNWAKWCVGLQCPPAQRRAVSHACRRRAVRKLANSRE